MLEPEATQRALHILGPFEEDPPGLRLSITGAEAALLQIAHSYAEYRVIEWKFGERPKQIKSELLEIADKAAELKKALMKATPIAWDAIWMLDCYVRENQTQETHWVERINYLEYLCRLSAENPKFRDGGGDKARAQGRLYGTPNHWLVRQCRALLTSCGKSRGGSKDGPLVKLLSAVAGKEESVQTSFNNDIKEVINQLDADLDLKFNTARLVLQDLRRRRPEGHPDIQEAERLVAEIPEKILTIRIERMASDLGLK